MVRLKTIIFYVFLFFVAVLSGLGIEKGNEAAFILITVGPFFLFLLDRIDKKKVFFPKKITFLFLILLILLSLSNFFSVDFVTSFEMSLGCFSLFLFFIYVYNHKEQLKKSLPIFINLLSIFYIIFSLVVRHISTNSFLYPFNDKNLVFPNHEPHNHLGDFLAVSTVFNFYYLVERFSWQRLLLILSFIPFLLFSHSRSAYVSLIVPLFFLVWQSTKAKDTKKHQKVILTSIFIFVLFLTTVFFITQPRSLLGGREYYFRYAVEGVKNRPLTGYGLGSFFSMVRQIKDKNSPVVQSSHNIFLDVFAGSGFFTGAIFMFIIFLIVFYGQKDIFWLCFLSLLINFQTDYTYRNVFMLLMFFICAAMTWSEEKDP